MTIASTVFSVKLINLRTQFKSDLQYAAKCRTINQCSSYKKKLS